MDSNHHDKRNNQSIKSAVLLFATWSYKYRVQELSFCSCEKLELILLGSFPIEASLLGYHEEYKGSESSRELPQITRCIKQGKEHFSPKRTTEAKAQEEFVSFVLRRGNYLCYSRLATRAKNAIGDLQLHPRTLSWIHWKQSAMEEHSPP